MAKFPLVVFHWRITWQSESSTCVNIMPNRKNRCSSTHRLSFQFTTASNSVFWVSFFRLYILAAWKNKATKPANNKCSAELMYSTERTRIYHVIYRRSKGCFARNSFLCRIVVWLEPQFATDWTAWHVLSALEERWLGIPRLIFGR